MILALASLLLLRGLSQGLFYSSHLILNLIVYLCAKFGALNQRINEIRSGGNLLQPLPQCQTSRFSIPTILWLSNLVAMFPRASGAIMDSNLHVSSHSYASRLWVMDQAESLKLRLKMEIFIKEYVSLIWLLSTIFTVAVGRILTNCQPCILSCSGHIDPNNFWPKWIPEIISCMMHTLTTSQHQKASASRMGTLGTHIAIRIHLAADSECLGAASRVSMSHSSHIPRDNIPKIAWEVFKYYIIS
jgi:hypothetical protein